MSGGLTGIERVGDTVRRSSGPWTPAVHALLQHLLAEGFEGSPRVLGLDHQAREILTWIEGDEASWSKGELAGVGRLVRRFHDAVSTFQPPADARWQFMVGAPREGIVCHNDLSPWNTIYRDGLPVAFIDWDLAAPAPALWDVAWAVHRYVPLFDPASCDRLGFPRPDYARRCRIFCDAYGLEDRSELFSTVCRRLEVLVDTARTWGEEGRPGWVDVWRQTGGKQWIAGRDFVGSHAEEWLQAL